MTGLGVPPPVVHLLTPSNQTHLTPRSSLSNITANQTEDEKREEGEREHLTLTERSVDGRAVVGHGTGAALSQGEGRRNAEKRLLCIKIGKWHILRKM